VSEPITRRDFLGGVAAVAGLPSAYPNTGDTNQMPATENSDPPTTGRADFRFVLLGDLHYDRPDHHDMEWLRREKPNDVRQVENYSRITAEVLPRLLAEVKARATEPGTAFIAHVGDFVEGLAGTPELARRHCRDAVAYFDGAALGRPFLFCKGNHDVTGPGSVEAFNEILLPYIGREAGQKLDPARGANYVTRHGDCRFVWYDAYHKGSLTWLEGELAEKRAGERVFLMIHPPVVPYGARSNWHIFAKPGEADERKRLLNLLGRNRAIVLCGHLHKYGTVVRQTDEGPFAQVAVVSVLPEADIKPKNAVSGVKEYGPDLVRLEPDFAPQTVDERRALLSAEAPHVRHYDYADAPGYATVTVTPAEITIRLHAGLEKTPFRTFNLTALLEK
jgi:hypothetical protein